MAALLFGEYAPDNSDLNRKYTNSVLNVVPRADGYGPFQDISALTAALPGQCRGHFYARKGDGSIAVFAGTATDLYMLDNTLLTWTLVSKGSSSYSTLSTAAQWQFEQFNDFVLATQANAALQVYDLTSSSEFDDVTGSPPQAAYIAIVNRFVVLSGLLSQPYRIQWSGLNDITGWTSGVNSSDFQDLPDGGVAKGVAGGELGFIFQDQSIRRMLFAPGSDVIFQIDRVAKDIGLLAPYSLVTSGNYILFLSAKGFMKLGIDGSLAPIGNERVDRTFFADFDSGSPQYMIGASSPETSRVIWSYRSTSFNGAAGFNKLLFYDLNLDRWSPIQVQGEFISTLARPGLTIEGLDAIAPGSQTITGAADNGSGLIRLTVGSTSGWSTGNVKAISGVVGTTEADGNWTVTVIDGTHIDLQGSAFSNAYVSGGIVGGSLDSLPFSLDDFSDSTLPKLAVVNSDHKLGFFSGPNLEATLQTAEQTAVQQRMFVRGFWPLTDAPALFGSTAVRESLQASPVFRPEQPIDVRGFVPQRASTRHARPQVRIPSGTVWTYISGIDPDVVQEGKR